MAVSDGAHQAWVIDPAVFWLRLPHRDTGFKTPVIVGIGRRALARAFAAGCGPPRRSPWRPTRQRPQPGCRISSASAGAARPLRASPPPAVGAPQEFGQASGVSPRWPGCRMWCWMCFSYAAMPAAIG